MPRRTVRVAWENQDKPEGKVRFGGKTYSDLKTRVADALQVKDPPPLEVKMKGEILIPEDDEEMPGEAFHCMYKSSAGAGVKKDDLLTSLQSIKEGFIEAVRQQTATLAMQTLPSLPNSPLARQQVTAPFSGVTSTEAFKVLEELGFTLVDGHAAEPLEDLPKGMVIPDFNFSEYRDEDEGLKDLMEYHREHLKACEVKFGRNAYTILDVHTEKKLELATPQKIYKGGVDVAIAPHGTPKSTATFKAVIIFEHKQNAKDKEIYRILHKPESEVKQGRDGDHRGQVTLAYLAVAALNEKPLDAVLFDGHLAVLFRLRRDELLIYENLPPSTLYPALASNLVTLSPLPKRRPTEMEIAALNPAYTQPHKKLHRALGMDDIEGPRAQMNSLIDPSQSALQQQNLMFETAVPWTPSIQPYIMSKEVQRMYS